MSNWHIIYPTYDELPLYQRIENNFLQFNSYGSTNYNGSLCKSTFIYNRSYLKTENRHSL